ncbi:MAG: hypothetical protein PVH89_10125 [Gammaproteobacteria bacterium]|jgi:hypothetical protein
MLDSQRIHSDQPRLEEAQSRFESLNADLDLKARSVLNRIVASSELHPKLMNTLSMLEHMGSQKIMATQHGSTIDQATLRHLAEECHHAYFMKRQAEKAAGHSLEYTPTDLLEAPSARMYFQRLEAAMIRRLETEQSVTATYLYMSMIIEFRAVWFYSLYQHALKRVDHSLSLKRLLGEEQNHLTAMAEQLEHTGELSDARIDSFIAIEHKLFSRFLDSLQQSLN